MSVSWKRARAWGCGLALAAGLGCATYRDKEIELVERGNAHLDRGDTDGAIAEYTKALELDHGRTINVSEATVIGIAHNNRALARRAKGDLDGALMDASMAVSLGGFTEYRRARGFLYQAKGDLRHAIEDYTEALEVERHGSQALLDRTLARVAAPPPGHALFLAAFYTLLGMRRASGESDFAILDYTHAILSDPTYAEAYRGRGRIEAEKCRRKEAILDLERALALGLPREEAQETRVLVESLRKQ